MIVEKKSSKDKDEVTECKKSPERHTLPGLKVRISIFTSS
jgi:hypothetical protein